MKKQPKWVIGALLWWAVSSLPAATLEQATSLLQQQQPDQALELIREQLAQTPRAANWLVLRADALSALGETGRAEDEYRQLIEQQPQSLAAYNGLARLLVAQGRLEEAGQVLEQALTDTDPVYATIYNNLQSINVAIARASYGKALRVDVPEQGVTLKPVTLVADNQEQQQVVAVTNDVDDTANTSQATESPSPAIPLANDDSVAIEETVHDWATAWADQQVSRYLSFYASDFQPDDGLSREEWQRQRQVRLRRPQWIRVSLDKLTVTEQSEQLAVVEFVQHYESDTYSDVTNKQLILNRDAQGWRIVRENTL